MKQNSCPTYDAGIKIYVLQNDCYVESENSPAFPALPILEVIPKAVERAKQIGTSQSLLEFEDWLNQQSA